MHRVILIAIALSLPLAGLSAATYTGSLAYNPPANASDDLQINGPVGQWDSYDHSITWTVTNQDPGAPVGYPWKYSYRWSITNPTQGTLQGAFSHLILETSPGFTQEDFVQLTGGVTFDSVGLQMAQSGNPNIPEDIYGIRFNPAAGGQFDLAWSFYSNRQPVWGDIYAKCGGGAGQNTAYNLGFTDPDNVNGVIDDIDPAGPASAGTAANHYFYHVLRPDTVGGPGPDPDPDPDPDPTVPEPFTLAMLGLGLAGLGGYTRRRGGGER